MFIQDSIKFVQNFAGVISESTPHLYLSGLPFSPPRSALANMLTEKFPNIAQVARGQHEDWPSNQHVLQGHTDIVNSIAFSSDGRHIVSGSRDQTIRVWDAQTGAQVGNPLQGHTKSVNSVAFSPDGRHIVSGSRDQTIRVWDAQTGAQVGNPLQGHTKSVSSVAFSPDGRHIVSGSLDETIRVWDAQTGAWVGNPLQGHTWSVNSVAFSPDGRHIVSGSWDQTIRVWDTQTGAQVGNPLQGHTWSVNSVAFSPDGRHIVSGSRDETIRVWNAQTGAQVGNALQGHTNLVNSVAFSPDGRHIVSGSEDHTIQVWDAQTESTSVQAGNFPTMQIEPYPPQFSPISMPTSILSAFPSAGDKLTPMAEHSMCLGHGLFLLDNGWIVGSSNQLFLWVPPSYHPFFWYSPSTTVIIGRFPVLDFSNMVHGSAWDQCFCACSDSK